MAETNALRKGASGFLISWGHSCAAAVNGLTSYFIIFLGLGVGLCHFFGSNIYWVFVYLTFLFFYDKPLLNTATANDCGFLMHFLLRQKMYMTSLDTSCNPLKAERGILKIILHVFCFGAFLVFYLSKSNSYFFKTASCGFNRSWSKGNYIYQWCNRVK